MMEQHELNQRIGVTDRMEEASESVRMSPREYDELKRQLACSPGLFVKTVRQRPDYRLAFLHLYLKLAAEAYEEYASAGIHDTIYYATMHDIVIWADNCHRRYGEPGIEEYDWLWRHVTLRLFQIGRLQYEKIEPEKDLILNNKTVRAGQKVLNLHIPQGGPLDFDQCRESIAKAKAFFRGYGEITCHSWLLNPAMNQLLGEESNIIKFQSLFDIYGLDEESRQAEERVFGRLEEAPGNYAENTALQRELKRYLLSGNKFGSAYGRIKCLSRQKPSKA